MTVLHATADRWLDWLTQGRDAGSSEIRRRSLELLLPIRDEVLRHANLQPGHTVLDVGTGEGLLGMGALEHVGPTGRVIFSDGSPAVIDHVRRAATELGVQRQVAFVVADAADLNGIPDNSVDAIVLRSVLIYVPDRGRAARAFARVLRPGGRLSLFEPLHAATSRDEDGASFFGYDTEEVAEEARAVLARFAQRQPASDPMLTLTTSELLAHCEQAGFAKIDAHEHHSSTSVSPADDAAVTALLHGQPNPHAPTVAQAAGEALDTTAARRFLRALTDAARAGRGRRRQAHVYLAATVSRLVELPARRAVAGG